MVVALLPPRRGAAPSQLTLFRRDDVKSELDRPLAFTLDAPPPSLGSLVSEEGATLQRLTASSLFRFNVQQGQDARVVMVLERLT